jgi:hypothetical protein
MTESNAAVYRNESQPDWGMGLVVEEGPHHWVLVFERGGRKKFVKEKAKSLVPVSLDAAALGTLRAAVLGKHAASAGGSPKAKGAPKRTPARFATFAEQVAFFEKLFIGGFEGERFVAEERGHPEAKGKAGYKSAAIAMAKKELSPERFNSASPAELFESAKRILGATNIVFPIEGTIPFGSIAESDRPAMLAALQHLLHGDGEYGRRLEQFAGAINLKDKTGKGRRVTWPLATLFGALYWPEQHTCVKPTYFAAQATTLGLRVEASQPVTASGYRQFFEVAKETQQRLIAAGHRPRDLVDVYSFIWRTHAEKPA